MSPRQARESLQNALKLIMLTACLSECLLHFPSVFVPVLLRIFTAGQSEIISRKFIKTVSSFPVGGLSEGILFRMQTDPCGDPSGPRCTHPAAPRACEQTKGKGQAMELRSFQPQTRCQEANMFLNTGL